MAPKTKKRNPIVNFMNILLTYAFFCTKVLCTSFLYLHIGFVIFWQKNISAKDAREMLMKLTTSLHLKCRKGAMTNLRSFVTDNEVIKWTVFVVPHEQIETNRHICRMDKVRRTLRDNWLLSECPNVAKNIGRTALSERVETNTADVIMLSALQMSEKKVVHIFCR